MRDEVRDPGTLHLLAEKLEPLTIDTLGQVYIIDRAIDYKILWQF